LRYLLSSNGRSRKLWDWKRLMTTSPFNFITWLSTRTNITLKNGWPGLRLRTKEESNPQARTRMGDILSSACYLIYQPPHRPSPTVSTQPLHNPNRLPHAIKTNGIHSRRETGLLLREASGIKGVFGKSGGFVENGMMVACGWTGGGRRQV